MLKRGLEYFPLFLDTCNLTNNKMSLLKKEYFSSGEAKLS